jgi:signal transduction histidine kinase
MVTVGTVYRLMRELTPELRALHDLARAAAQGEYEVEDLLRRICSAIIEIFEFDRASVARYVAEGKLLVPLVALNVDEAALPEFVPLESQPLFERALEAGEAVFVEDVRVDPVLSPELIETFGVRSVLAVPLIAGGECLGFISADRGGRVFRLEQSTLDLLTTIGTVSAVFVARAFELSELRRLNELKSNFIALASHELRTPVAVVHGIAATLHLRGDELAGDQLEQLRRTLHEQTDRTRRLVDQLLDLSRLEANAIPIRPERFRVRRRVEEVVLGVAGERMGEVNIEIPPDVEGVADPDAFDRVVSNLVTNALRYGAPPVIVTAQPSDRHLRLVVEDRGRGVSPEFVPALFERFTRSETSGGTLGGAGLGLSIAQSYAHAHGGELFYEPAEPHGARFELVLPVGNAVT